MVPMPIYEYVCSACEHAFEALVYGSERPACPSCSSRELEKQFSTFGTRRGTAEPDAPLSGRGSCGTCGDPRGPGACSLN